MEKVKWSELIVTDKDGDFFGILGDIVRDSPANLDNATIEDSHIEAWDGFFISAPGEDPDYDTPRCAVDWNGFKRSLYPNSDRVRFSD